MAVITADATSAPMSERAAGHRVAAIDIVRGVVMILMAIDHVRVYSGVPAGGPTPAVFFTRWITHFVAPTFIFLAGTAAFLHGRRLTSRGELARFLLTRGAWLILLELSVIRLAWTFNFDYGNYLLAGVIWVIGLCMMLLAALVYLPMRVIAALGIVIIAAHNLIDLLPAGGAPGEGDGAPGWLWQLVYAGGGIQLGNGPWLVVLYTVVPWIGVLAAGYAFGTIMVLPVERRRRICVTLGLAAIALFVLLRLGDFYGDPRSWRALQGAPALLRFLNTAKYPASLQFLLMTLGPMLLALGLVHRARGRIASVLATFGRVPLFYYLLHIPLVHAAALLVSLLRSGAVDPWLFANHPIWPPDVPAGYTWSLPLLYLVTALVVAVLYIPCRYFARLKEERKDLTWLSYL